MGVSIKDGGVALSINLGNGRLDTGIKNKNVRFDDDVWHHVVIFRVAQQVCKFILIAACKGWSINNVTNFSGWEGSNIKEKSGHIGRGWEGLKLQQSWWRHIWMTQSTKTYFYVFRVSHKVLVNKNFCLIKIRLTVSMHTPTIY